MKYRLLLHRNAATHDEEVNRLLSLGWQLRGNFYLDKDSWIYQAMIKGEEYNEYRTDNNR